MKQHRSNIFAIIPLFITYICTGAAFGAGYQCDDLIEYEVCFDGLYLTDTKQCAECPADSYCAPIKPNINSVQFSCAIQTGNPFAQSAPGSKDISDCFIMCDGVQLNWTGDSATFNCICPYYEKMGKNGCEPCNIENALGYQESEGSNCIVTECAVGFHPENNQCVPNSLDCTADIENATHAELKWNSANNQFDTCVVTECATDYHINEDATACVYNTEDCELTNGRGTRTWDSDANAWGKCIATQCNTGYTNDPDLTNATDPTQCGECANAYGENGDRVVSFFKENSNNCEIEQCMHHNKKYTLDAGANQCILICTGSDETGTRQWNEARQECEHQCADGYSVWE